MRDQIQQFTKNATDNYTETNDRILEAVVDTNRKVVDFAVKTADQMTERLDQIEQMPEIKLGDKVPTPAETGARYMEFVDRAVEMNRDYTQRVIERLLADEATAPATKPAAKKAPAKKAAKKPAAKKPAAKKTAAKKPAAKKAAAAN